MLRLKLLKNLKIQAKGLRFGFIPLKKISFFRNKPCDGVRGCSFITGFTLVEILLVTAMLSVIGLTIYSTFSSGINFWLRISQQQPTEDIAIFFEKISYDLRNSFKYTGIDFKGSNNEVSFPTIAKFEGKNGKEEGIGRMTYFFDGAKNTICTKQSNYSEVYQDKAGYKRELVKNIESLSFRYYYYDRVQKEYFWTSSWQEKDDAEKLGLVMEKNIPLAVKIEVEVQDGQFRRKLQRTVFIPAAYYLSFSAQ